LKLPAPSGAPTSVDAFQKRSTGDGNCPRPGIIPPRGEGVWRDDAQGGRLLFDNPVVIQCYTSEHLIEQRMPALRDFLHRMGREARQGAIGLVIDDDYLEIGFPLEEAPKPHQPKGKKRR
jgi:hypothetical protein